MDRENYVFVVRVLSRRGRPSTLSRTVFMADEYLLWACPFQSERRTWRMRSVSRHMADTSRGYIEYPRLCTIGIASRAFSAPDTYLGSWGAVCKRVLRVEFIRACVFAHETRCVVSLNLDTVRYESLRLTNNQRCQ